MVERTRPTDIQHVMPPWQLSGNGCAALYRFSADEARSLAPDWLKDHAIGGLGAMMLIDYRRSNVGPYRELLLVPGRFKLGRRRLYSVTHIYVSTEESQFNGQVNWGIPKQVADFEVEDIDTRTHRWTASKDGVPFFKATVTDGLLRFPFNTAVNPFPATLIQERDIDRARYYTAPQAGGSLSLARMEDVHIDGAYFPDMTQHRLLGVLQSYNLRMKFPLPKLA